MNCGKISPVEEVKLLTQKALCYDLILGAGQRATHTVPASMETVPAPLVFHSRPGIHNLANTTKVMIGITSNLPYNVMATVVTRSLPNGSVRLESACGQKTEPIFIKGEGTWTNLWLVLNCQSATSIVQSAEPAFELHCVSVNACIVDNTSTGGKPMIARAFWHLPVFLKAAHVHFTVGGLGEWIEAIAVHSDVDSSTDVMLLADATRGSLGDAISRVV